MKNRKKQTPAQQPKIVDAPKEIRKQKKANMPKAAIVIPFEKLESFLGANKRYIAIGILTISLLIRFIYYKQATDTPITVFHNWDQSDMNFFDVWAKEIVKGDVLTNQSLHPQHGWYKDLADAYFIKYPDEEKKYQALTNGDTTKAAWIELWNHWYGEKQFHQEPVYPYLVAATYKLFGADVQNVFIWQLLLGSCINLLIYLLACRYFGNLTGVCAGLLAILCGPIAFYDMLLLRSTLTVFLSLLTLFAFDFALRKQQLRYYIFFGLIMGITYLTQAYFVFFIVFAIGYLIYLYRLEIPVLLRGLGGFAIGFGLVLMLLVSRNMSVGVSLFSVNSNSAISFISGNNNAYEPSMGFGLNPPLTVEIMHKTDGKFLPSVVETLKSHEGLGFIGLLWRKIKVIFFWYEMPNNASYYYFQQYATVLKGLFVTFYIIAPLGLVGLALALWKRRESMPLVAMMVVNLAPVMIMSAFSRYRVGLMAAMIPLAAFAIIEFLKSIRAFNLKNMVIIGAAICIAFLFTVNSGSDNVSKFQIVDFNLGYNLYYVKDIQKYANNKEWAKCAEVMQDFIKHEPEVIIELNAYNKVKNADEYNLAKFFSEIHVMYANILTNNGNTAEAAIQMARSEALKKSIENMKIN